MFRNFHNSKGSSTNPRNQNSRWRIIFIALVLALVIGSVGQTPAAQAAPAGRVVYLSMKVLNPKITLRCGQTVSYIAQVVVQDWDCPPSDAVALALGSNQNGSGAVYVEIEASSSAKGVGDFVGRTKARTQMFFDDLVSLGAKFKFKANKPGETTLIFRGYVGNQLISDVVNVKVLPCKFKVKTVLQFPVEIYDITVISDNAVMTADEGGAFTGSTSMYWAYSNFNLAPCTIEIGATDSQVDMTGQLDEDGGQFTATQTFQPQEDAGIVSCPGGIGGGEGAFTVAPITFSVASTGGVSIQTVTAEGVSGLAHIVVTPEEDKAVSFIPGDHEASWDDFSSLFGILLALY